MKNVLIISFDLIRRGEVSSSLSIASILAFLKNDSRYGHEFIVHHLPVNMFDLKCDSPIDFLDKYLSAFDLENFDTIAISCYIWSEYLINPIIKHIRAYGFRNKIVLGGYQISYSSTEKLQFEYPDCDIFICGYAEESFLRAIYANKPKLTKLIFADDVDFLAIPSPFLSGEILVSQSQKMVRIETKRGCPYKCSFCAHRDLRKNKVYKHSREKILMELDFLKEKQVQKINVLDPVFNQGSSYLNVMREIKSIKLASIVSFQTRFELIKEQDGESFLDLAGDINSHLEFGLQSIIETECKAINRNNNRNLIRNVMKQLNQRKISYEISLIYGLPNQTLDSFKQSLDFVYSNGCSNVRAYPLMLLKGTELYHGKEKWRFKEKRLGEFRIPVVVESDSFTEQEWWTMKALTESLGPTDRF